MADFPKKFSDLSSPLASYDWIDIASGTGIIKFYAGATVDKYLLSHDVFYSEPSSTQGLLSGTGIDVDFDVLLNKPFDLQGTVVVNLPVNIALGADAGYCDFTITVRKWDGSTETDIASNAASRTTGTINDTKYFMKAIDLTIPLTHYPAGTYLRLNITGTGVTGGSPAAGRNFNIAHDPANRTAVWDATGAVPSQLVFQVPVRSEA